MKQNSCIVVTGANGLAGSAVVEHLRERGFTFVVPLTRDDADLMDADRTGRFFGRVQPEYVFHAAATVYGLQGNMDNQYKAILNNTMINTNVINASHWVGVKKIVVMGTNAIYPWPAILPYREENIFDGRPHDGEAGYGHAKRHMLAMLEASGMNYTYLVSGNLYGPRDNFNEKTGHVLPSLIHKFWWASVPPKNAVDIWGDGSARRDFLHSADLADIASLFMGNDFTGPINIGSGTTVAIRDIAKLLSDISGVDWSDVRFDTSKPTGRPECYSDLSKLHALGWQPKVSFADGLRSTYDWYSVRHTRS